MARKRRRPGLTLGLWGLASAVLAAGLGAVWLAAQAETKLSALALGGLGESFSTRVWSAPFAVRDGARSEPERLFERLDRLGYRRVDGTPAKGEYRWSPPELDVYLRGYRAPTSAQDEGAYSLRRDDSGAWRIKDGLGGALAEVRLEPELAAQLSGARKERRDPLAYEQIPRALIDAVTSAEDKRFWTHWGLDPRAMLRAAWANARGHELQGASTITQQLSKNLFLTPRRTVARKLAEAALAVYLELRLGKKRILTLYLNSIYLGQDGSASVMGMRAASRYYFSKDPADLTLAQAATLAGLIRGPGFYSPFHDLAASRARRDWVLHRMRDNGLISEDALQNALAEPLIPVRGSFEEDRRDNAYYVAEVVRQLLPRYGGDVLYRNGLSIYTAMDPVLQSLAQDAARGAKHQAALVALDPRTGDVLALAGGRDFSKSQFNRATQAARQPGSAFKPFVYAAALRMGLTPATILRDKPRTYGTKGGDWSPGNYDGVYFGTATMREAITHSLNAATLDLASRVTIQRVQELAREAGITSPLRDDLGLALGASEVGLLELVSAYEPFADGGQRPEPRLVTAVLDADGGVLEAPPPESTVVLDPAVAYLMTSLMESVVKDGTARSLKRLGFDSPAAGKTGTTNDGRDAWFVGYTSSILAGVWTGADDDRALKLTGAKDALPLWAKFMIEASADRPAEEFVRPDGLVQVRICVESGMLARSGCPKKLDELFIVGTEPMRECPLHRGGIMGWFDRLTR
ncbi:MAG TPA: PBP1A family penicillin-binding protein [Elusimicrobiota bacterium]|jgi:penicillin-binding protein 1B|nr:PBP1A family penicillin-binding protein [Elusimicrobiota bacterium]